MPLLKRKPFSPKKPPPDLKPEEEVFVCCHTNEVFRDYGSFFERTILCSSLLWSCKYTGKSGLTYREAHESEKAIVKQAKSLPEPIQRAVLTLVHHTQRGQLANLCDEVFSYLKDRFQEGEEVEILYPLRRRKGVITRVIPPEENGSPSGRPVKSSKLTETSHISSPKGRKQSDELLNARSSKKIPHNVTPPKARKQSSSSDDRPLSTKVNKQNVDSVAGKSPKKTQKKSFQEESPSNAKARKHSSESSSEKLTPSGPRKHSLSDEKNTPSRPNSGDKIAKKLSMSSSNKGSDGKLVSPNRKAPPESRKFESPKSKKSLNMGDRKRVENEVIIILDDLNNADGRSLSATSPAKVSSPSKEKRAYVWPDAALYKYEVRLYSEKGERVSKKREKHHEMVVVQASIVSRKKGVLTRDKLKMLLKITCERTTPQSGDGFYIVKEDYRHRFDLGDPDIPLKQASPPSDKKRRKRSLSLGAHEGENGPVKKRRKRKEEQTSNSGEGKWRKREKKDKDVKHEKKRKLTPEQRKRIMEEEKEKRKRDLEEEKERRKVEKEREKAENKAKREEEKAVKKMERDREDYRHRFDLGDPDIPLKLASPPSDKKRRKRSLSLGAHEGENGPVKKRRKRKEEQTSNSGEGKWRKREKKDKDVKHEKKRKLTPEQRKRIMEEEKEKRKRDLEEEKERRKVEKEREKAENKAKREEEKAVKKMERDRERERLKEEKRLEAVRLKEWSKPREDLELDDLMELPVATPISIKLSAELFGDMMMVLEFLNVFGGIFDMKDEFPSGLTFAMLEEALTEHDAEGIYYDLLLFLLGAILRTHLEEEEEEGLDGSHEPEAPVDLDDDADAKGATVSASAIMAAAWPMQHQGKPFHELIMDPFTSSELLRLHLLSSGARLGCGESSYRWQRRGGFTYNDDAGVEFRHSEPHLLKALVIGNVYDMAAEDKLKILIALCTQLMTYATSRDYVEEGFDQCRKVRREWQEDQWADQRKDKEEAAARYRRKQEERQRQKEEMERRKKEKDQERVDGAKGKASQRPEAAPPSESEQATENLKKGDKKNGTVKATLQDDESKVVHPPSSGSQVNGSRATEEKEGDLNTLPVLTKEEEEDLAQQRREERRRKDQEFANLLTKAWSRSGVQPLGRDRVFRRYWSFKSLKGLFVEDDDCEQHLLLQSDPESEPEDEREENAEEPQVKADMEGLEKDAVGSHGNPIDLTNGHNCTKPVKKGRASLEREIANMFKVYNLPWDDAIKEKVREVYKNRQVVKWSYFTNKEDLDGLLDSLNPRGFREKLLKEAIQQDYKRLVTAIEKCPLKEEVQAQKRDSKAKGKRGGRNQPTVDKSRYKTMEEFIEANLRDQILDLEDRIWQGSLGGVKTQDRIAWRARVENGIYSRFCAPVKEDSNVNGVEENGGAEPMDVDKCVEEDRDRELSVDEAVSAANGDVDEGLEDRDKVHDELTAAVDAKQDEPSVSAVPSYLKLDSAPSSPSTDTRTSTPTVDLIAGRLVVNPAVKELASDLLKVEQGIEHKFLNPPLGEDEETKKHKQREAAAAALNDFNEMMKTAEAKSKHKKDKKKAADDVKEEKDDREGEEVKDNSTPSTEEPAAKQKTRLERWRDSLLACTNLSQVFVHLNTLDQSITWSKSVLNARCRLCRRKGDAEHMLLCDACDRGHHMYCLKPPIKEVPEGQWFCADCRPKETRRSERRKKPVAREDDAEEERSYEKEKSSDEEEEEASDEDDEEPESESEVEDGDQQTGTSSDSSQHGDQCALCTEGGELLCCDTCPLAYHLTCAYPSLRRIPRGNWACQVCTGADDDRPRGSRVKKSTIEAAQKQLQRTIKLVKKKATRAGSRAGSRQDKGTVSHSRKRKVSCSPSPPSRVRREAEARKKTKRRTVSSSSSSSSSRSPSPISRPVRRSSAQGIPRGRTSIDSSRSSSPVVRPNSKAQASVKGTLRGRRSIDSSRSSSPAVRPISKTQASKGTPKLPARLTLCQKLLDKLMKHEDAWPFLEPVDVSENPDYFNYVREPRDLGTIKKNLSDRAYESVEDFAADVRQVFINCSEYCRPRAKEARAGIRLSAFFETQYSEMGLDATETRSTRSRRT